MQAKQFSITDALKFGFAKTLDHFGLFFSIQCFRWFMWLVGYGVLFMIVSGGLMPFRMMWCDSATYPVTDSFSYIVVSLFVLGFLIIEFFDSVIALGLIKITLDIKEYDRSTFSVVFSPWRRVLGYIGVMLLYRIIVAVGFVLFVIPGIIWAIQFGFALQAFIDKSVGPLDALRLSSQITKGARVSLLWFFSVIFIINCAGLFFFGLGILITVPFSLLAYAYAYRTLSQQSL